MFTVLATLAAASAQPAGVTYLQCTTTQYGQPVHWNITLNEPEGTVVYNTKVGWQRRAARFTADAVYFIGFKLSRTNLTMQRPEYNLDGSLAHLETGTCRVAPQVNRAF